MTHNTKSKNIIFLLILGLSLFILSPTGGVTASPPISPNYSVDFYLSANNVFIGDQLSIFFVVQNDSKFNFASGVVVTFDLENYSYTSTSTNSYSILSVTVPNLSPGMYQINASINSQVLSTKDLVIRNSDTSCIGCDFLNMNSTVSGLVDYTNLTLANIFSHWMLYVTPNDFLTVNIYFDSYTVNIFADFVANLNYLEYVMYDHLTFDISMALPYWLNTFTNYTSEVVYSGNPYFSESKSQFAFSIKESWNATYSLSHSIINRNTTTDYVLLDFSETYTSDLTYDLSVNSQLVQSGAINNTQQFFSLDFDPSISLGPVDLDFTFYRVGNPVNFLSIPVTVIDSLRTNITLLNDVQNDSILRFNIITQEYDTGIFTPVNVSIYDNSTIVYSNLSNNGNLTDSVRLFDYYPNLSSKVWNFSFTPLNNFVINTSVVKIIPVRSSTSLVIHDPVNSAFRSDTIIFSASVYDLNYSLNEGIIDIFQSSTLLASIDLSISNSTIYTIPTTFPLGNSTITYRYGENSNYFGSFSTQELFVTSNPVFSNVKFVNSSYTVDGFLIDENMAGVTSRAIDLYNTSSGSAILLTSTTTDSLGYFSFSLNLTQTTDLLVKFNGDTIYSPIFYNFSVTITQSSAPTPTNPHLEVSFSLSSVNVTTGEKVTLSFVVQNSNSSTLEYIPDINVTFTLANYSWSVISQVNYSSFNITIPVLENGTYLVCSYLDFNNKSSTNATIQITHFITITPPPVITNYSIDFFLSKNNVFSGDQLSLFYVIRNTSNFDFIAGIVVNFQLVNYTYSSISTTSYNSLTLTIPILSPGPYQLLATIQNNNFNATRTLTVRNTVSSCQNCDYLIMNSSIRGLVDYDSLVLDNIFQHWIYLIEPTDYVQVYLLFDTNKLLLFSDFVTNITYTDYQPYSHIAFSLNLSLPYWLSPTYNYSLLLMYSGNTYFSESTTQFSFSIREYWNLSYTLSNFEIDRNTTIDSVLLDFSNVPLTNLSYDLFLNTTLVQTGLINSSLQTISLYFGPTTPLGFYSLHFSFKRNNNTVNSLSFAIYVYDTLQTKIFLLNEVQNDSILYFQIISVESDTNLPVEVNISIYDGITLFYQSSSRGNITDFIRLFDFYSNLMNKTWNFSFTPLNNYIVGHSELKLIPVRSSTSLLINFNSILADRLQTISFSVNVFDSTNNSVNEGIVGIYNGATLLTVINLTISNTSNYAIPPYFLLGQSTLIYRYIENSNYFGSSSTQELFVTSNPVFSEVTYSNKTFDIIGLLSDEVAVGLSDQVVELYNTTGGSPILIASSTTNSSGYFTFPITIDQSNDFLLKYNGYLYYNPSNYNFSVTVSHTNQKPSVPSNPSYIVDFYLNSSNVNTGDGVTLYFAVLDNTTLAYTPDINITFLLANYTYSGISSTNYNSLIFTTPNLDNGSYILMSAINGVNSTNVSIQITYFVSTDPPTLAPPQNNNTPSTNYTIDFFLSKNNVFTGDQITVYFVVQDTTPFDFIAGINITFSISGNYYSTTSTTSYNSLTFTIPTLSPGQYQLTGFIQNNNYNSSKTLTVRDTDTSCQNCDPLVMSSSINGIVDYNSLKLYNTFSHWVYYIDPNDYVQVSLLFDNKILVLYSDYMSNITYVEYQQYNHVAFELQLALPYWLSTSTSYTIVVSYSGNPFFLESSINVSFIIKESWTIQYTITDQRVDRNTQTDYISFDFSNTYLTGLSYYFYLNTTNGLSLVENKSVSSTFTQIYLFFDSTTPLGNATVMVKLYRGLDFINQLEIPIFVYDTLASEIILQNDIGNSTVVEFQIRTFETDTLLNKMANISIYDGSLLLYTNLSDGVLRDKIILSQFYTSYAARTWTFIVTPLNSTFVGNSKDVLLTVKSSTFIIVNNQFTSIERLAQISFSASVFDAFNDLVTTGELEIYINSTLITTLNLSLTNSFDYIIPRDFSLGSTSVEYIYKGTDNYFTSSNSQQVFIISQPSLINIEINNTSTSVGEPVEVSGRLVDESNKGIITTLDLVKIQDNVETVLESATTDVNGSFFFLYITEDYDLGLYQLKINYGGDGLYYLPVSYKVNLFQNRQFSFSIEGHEAGGVANISIVGDAYAHFTLSYGISIGSNDWSTISDLFLDEFGQLTTSILLPDVFGPFILKVYDVTNNISTYYDYFTFKTPVYKFTFLNEPYTYVDTFLLVNSSVSYQLLLDDKVFFDQNLIYKENKTFKLNINDYGEHKLTLKFMGNYLLFDEATQYFNVYQTTDLTLSIPNPITEGSKVTILANVKDKHGIPINNATISLYKNGELVSQSISDEKGLVSFQTVIYGSNFTYRFIVEDQPNLFIKKHEFSFPSTILRHVDITIVNTNSKVFSGIPSLVKFKLEYKYNNIVENTGIIQVRVKLWKGNELIFEKTDQTNNKGEYTLLLKDLSPGSYSLDLSIDKNSSVIPNTQLFEFEVVSVSDSTVNLPIIFAVSFLMFSVIGSIVFKKKVSP